MTAAQKAAAADDTADEAVKNIKFKFDNRAYEVPRSEDWDLDLLDAFEQGQSVAALRQLLGPEQFQKFRQQKKRTTKDINAFYEALGEAAGTGNL